MQLLLDYGSSIDGITEDDVKDKSVAIVNLFQTAKAKLHAANEVASRNNEVEELKTQLDFVRSKMEEQSKKYEAELNRLNEK